MAALAVGCLSSPSPAPSAPTAPPSPDASTFHLEPLYRLDRNDTTASASLEERFAVPRGHWLCLDWTLDRSAGAANLTLVDALGHPFYLYDTALRPNATGDDMVPSIAGNWTVRLALTGWTGRARLSVEDEV